LFIYVWLAHTHTHTHTHKLKANTFIHTHAHTRTHTRARAHEPERTPFYTYMHNTRAFHACHNARTHPQAQTRKHTHRKTPHTQCNSFYCFISIKLKHQSSVLYIYVFVSQITILINLRISSVRKCAFLSLLLTSRLFYFFSLLWLFLFSYSFIWNIHSFVSLIFVSYFYLFVWTSYVLL